jgi:hypothetical protein
MQSVPVVAVWLHSLHQRIIMTKPKYSPYKAALRRKKIAKAKKLKALKYIEDMNKKANQSANV